MSLTKEVAHDLRAVTTQPEDLAVLPSWVKILPIAFYVGFAFFLAGMGYNTFLSNIYNARRAALNRVTDEYNQMIAIDRQTISRLVEQKNAAVRVARWVDYSPSLQLILLGIFTSLDGRTQIDSLVVERRDSIRPEYSISMAFRSAQEDIGNIINAMKEGLAKQGWSLVTGAQVYQENVTNFQGFLQPILRSMPLESQYLSILPNPNMSSEAAPGSGIMGEPTGGVQ